MNNKKIIRNTDAEIQELLLWYQKQAARTFKVLPKEDQNTAHIFMGICTEWGELLDIFKANLAYDKPIDEVNLHEEWGDGMFYFMNFASMYPKEMSLNSPFLIDLLDEKLISGKGVSASDVAIGFGSTISITDFQYMFEYWFEMVNHLNIDVEKALKNNIEKLKIRYPEGFSNENALNRDLEAERKALESDN